MEDVIFTHRLMAGAHHGGDVIVSLEELNNLGLVGGLHAGEAAGSDHGLGLLRDGQVVKLAAGVGLSGHILILGEDANTTADGDGGSLVVA